MATENGITPAPGKDKTAKMVISYSSPVPHMVSKGREGQYKCDSNCLNWATSGICSHSLVVAQLNNDLPAFLQWYNASSDHPNISSLAMSGLPSGRGRKGGVAKRVRDRQVKKTPEISVPRTVFQAVASTDGHSSSAMSTGTSSAGGTLSSPFQTAVHVPSANVFHSAVVGQINLPSQLGHATSVISPSSSNSQSVVQTSSATPPNTNPFYVKFMQGNIRMCQGCRSSLRSQDGSIPNPPFDAVIARAERRSFRDKNGVLITPRQEQTCHYHLRLDCVKAVEPTFVPLALQVPGDVLPSLTFIHREYLRLLFGLELR